MMKGIILSIVLLLSCSSIVEGGIFLKVNGPLIVQEAVWLYSNSTAITQVALDVPANKFIKTVSPFNNVPDATPDGTIGVLYNRDDSCSPNTINETPTTPFPFYAPSPKLSKMPKIAFIKKQGGNCTLIQKILNAQSEGAIGAIVYDTISGMTTEQDRKAGVLPESGIIIPTYYADYSVGVNLLHQLEKMDGVPIHTIPTYDNVTLTTRISVRVSLMPANNVKPCAWELTLLVMLVLLGTSVFFSVLMHFYMWKKNQRLQNVVERHRATAAANPLPMGKALLNIARLYQFPTRIVDTLPDGEEHKKVETVLSDEKQREALIKTTTLSSSTNGNQSVKQNKSIFIRKKIMRKLSVTPSTNTAVKIDAPVNNMCVICLEAFKIGDEVRKLPCHHEFHSETCIDPWLTSKSGECPLCKFDCSSDSQSEKTMRPEEEDYANVPGIRGMWLRFKANRKKRTRIGQVAPRRGDIEQQRQQSSRQSTMVQEAPPSSELRAALRAVEAIEAASHLGQQITTAAAAEPAIAATKAEVEEEASNYAERQHQQEEQQQQEKTDPTVASLDAVRDETSLRPSIATTELSQFSTNTNTTSVNLLQATIVVVEQEEPQPRFSTATNLSELSSITENYSIAGLSVASHSVVNSSRPISRDETIQRIISNTSSYARPSPSTTNNITSGLLPDIDVSAISLCSIDLGGRLAEEFHNIFKK